jgi:hypothetical protein
VRTRPALLALLVCGALSGALAPAASAAPRTFFGVNPVTVPSPEQSTRVAKGGVGSVRYSLPWGDIQPAQGGPIDWTQFDALVTRAASTGVEVLPVIWGTPAWAGSRTTLPVATATQRDGWAAFVSAAVRRYGPGGEFWAAHGPASLEPLPYAPVRKWQLWNEQNYRYFASHPNPRSYGQLLKISSPAIRGVDPGATIMLGGLFGRPNPAEVGGQAIAGARFLDRLYRVKGIKGTFDAVALHPYTRTAKQMIPQVREMRAVMRDNKDARTGFYITEMAWGSVGNSSFDKGAGGQAKELKRAYGLLLSGRKAWRLRGAYWFSLTDQAPGEGCIFCDSSGLFTISFEPKPAWFAFAKLAGGQP